MPTWETPQLVMQAMIEAHLSLVDSKGTCCMRCMTGLDVVFLRMGRRGFCSGSLTGDKSGAKAGIATSGATSAH